MKHFNIQLVDVDGSSETKAFSLESFSTVYMYLFTTFSKFKNGPRLVTLDQSDENNSFIPGIMRIESKILPRGKKQLNITQNDQVLFFSADYNGENITFFLTNQPGNLEFNSLINISNNLYVYM